MSIPIIDLGKFFCNPDAQLNISSEDWVSTATCLKTALQKIGFVYLHNHGVPSNQTTSVFNESLKFFKQPLDKKMLYARDFQSTFHGYTKVGGERMTLEASVELREMFDVAMVAQSDFENCPYPEKEVPDFKPAVQELFKGTKNLVRVLLKLLAIALDLKDEHYFIDVHQNIQDSSVPNHTQLRTLYYPEISEDISIRPGVVRCAEHTDYGTLTLLFQDNMGGLEIKSVDGNWISATPAPGCVLMNVGDLLQIWSAGLFPSSVHRVIVPTEQHKLKVARQSIAIFLKPDNETLVKPLIRDKCRDSKTIMLEEPRMLMANKTGVNAGEHFRKRSIYHRQIAYSIHNQIN